MVYKVEKELGGRRLIIESGQVAKQANGAVTVRYGDTVILATVVASQEPVLDKGFLPLFVEYREKAYAAGKIPGGFFKREGRPREKETLSARLVDRPLRPLFPLDFPYEIQIVVTVLSADQENDADILGMIGASAAVTISDIPFQGPVGAVRVGRIGGEYILNPTFSQLDSSELDLVIAGTATDVIMVEGSAREVSEKVLLDGIIYSRETINQIIEMQSELAAQCGQPNREIPPLEVDRDLLAAVEELTAERLSQANTIPRKLERGETLDRIIKETVATLADRFPEKEGSIISAISELEKRDMRQRIMRKRLRIDGRGPDDLRPISCEVGILPRTHGSALFTRGETQSLVVTTLGTKMDEQKIDDLEGESWKSYMLHYNFPPFSVGEVRPIRGPGRREIGHGALAERVIQPVIPTDEIFPYTIRIVSDILESNGSSSMATICGGSLSLMDAGVPIKTGVSGVAIGLVKEGENWVVLTDILGAEDHLGDMDFKVAGTKEGITGFQMDLKIEGVDYQILWEALEKARSARLKILEVMNQTISRPRPQLSSYAPKIITLKVPQDKIGEIIGPGGKIIRKIIEETQAKIDIDDDGTVTIAAADEASGRKAKELIDLIIEEPEVGRSYQGTVKRVVDFGAFVEILPQQEGLLHISEIDHQRIGRVGDVLKVGDRVMVKVTGIDPQGKIRLSRKALLPRGGRK